MIPVSMCTSRKNLQTRLTLIPVSCQAVLLETEKEMPVAGGGPTTGGDSKALSASSIALLWEERVL